MDNFWWKIIQILSHTSGIHVLTKFRWRGEALIENIGFVCFQQEVCCFYTIACFKTLRAKTLVNFKPICIRALI